MFVVYINSRHIVMKWRTAEKQTRPGLRFDLQVPFTLLGPATDVHVLYDEHTVPNPLLLDFLCCVQNKETTPMLQ